VEISVARPVVQRRHHLQPDAATYKDGNGDGVGDFKGLTERIDHVAPALGTLGDFVEFSHQARLRGLRLIVDLPINHTSEQHLWFQQARCVPSSPFRDYYVWSKVEPENATDGVVFPGFQSSVWTYDLRARACYYHRFYQHQPDLNIACLSAPGDF
jgi:maltose alpha-D-glucosyltransferase/alpha-amylase